MAGMVGPTVMCGPPVIHDEKHIKVSGSMGER